MGVEQEATVRVFLTEFEGDQLDSGWVDRVVDRMSQDARYHVLAWHDPLIGHEAIRTELLRQIARFRGVRFEVVTIGSVGQTVFTERVDSLTLNDKQVVAIHVAGVFEVDSDAKIAAWRDYVDSREVAVKFGAA